MQFTSINGERVSICKTIRKTQSRTYVDGSFHDAGIAIAVDINTGVFDIFTRHAPGYSPYDGINKQLSQLPQILKNLGLDEDSCDNLLELIELENLF